MKTRKQIDAKYKWKVADLISSDEKAYEIINNLKELTLKVNNFKGKLKNEKMLLAFFNLTSEISYDFELVGTYSYLKYCEDLSNSKYIEMQAIIENIGNNYAIASSFSDYELSKLSNKILNKLFLDKKFRKYKMSILEIIRNKPHVLELSEEALIAKTSKFCGAFSDIFENFDALDIKFNNVSDSKGKSYEVSIADYSTLIESPDRVLRKNASNSYYNGFKSLKNTIATNYIASVKKDVCYSKIYKFNSNLEESLFGINVSEKLYTNLIENVQKNLNLVHKYNEYRKLALGFKDFTTYDLCAPISKFNKKFTLNELKGIIINALSPLGKYYIEIIKKAFEENWIDFYPHKNKATGGFETGVYGFHPYILTNIKDNIDGVLTVAHELGHALHTYLSNKNNDFETASYPIFLAEIASTLNEILVMKFLLNNLTDGSQRLYLIDKYLFLIKSTLYNQTQYSMFEEFAHKRIENDEPLSLNILVDYYSKLNKQFYGKSVKENADLGFSWLRVPHFYRSFYVYKYATGVTCAIAFASKILNHENNAVENYLNFLKSGGSDYPNTLLKQNGIDLESNEPYNLIFKETSTLLKEFKTLILNNKKTR